MSSRIVSLWIAGLLSLGVLCGCPTRSASEAISAGSGGATTSPQDIDAGVDTSTTNIMVSDDADVDAPDPGAVDANVDSVSEPETLPPPPLSDVGVLCTVDAQCATGSCVDAVCCASTTCGGCQSCAVPGSAGACSPLPKHTEDPRSSCVGTNACDGAGHCAEFNGNACQARSDCISGFCVDGVCCESACDQTCFACNAGFQVRGMCLPRTAGTDLNASAPCGGSSSCAPGLTSDQPLCLLNDGQPCAAAGDCASGQCSTFYADADGDKFGDPLRSITVCGPSDARLPGYVTAAGDCCDSDGNAHPNQSEFFRGADACESFDYNCDGDLQKQETGGTCAGYLGGASPACGKACLALISGAPVVLYTQACR